MLAPQVTEIGVGIARGPERDPKFISVQLFGRPESFKYKFEIENFADVEVGYTFASQRLNIPPSVRITHTNCSPSAITFDLASVTSTFETHDGARFRIKRGATGKPVVEAERASALQSSNDVGEPRRNSRRALTTGAIKPKQ